MKIIVVTLFVLYVLFFLSLVVSWKRNFIVQEEFQYAQAYLEQHHYDKNGLLYSIATFTGTAAGNDGGGSNGVVGTGRKDATDENTKKKKIGGSKIRSMANLSYAARNFVHNATTAVQQQQNQRKKGAGAGGVGGGGGGGGGGTARTTTKTLPGNPKALLVNRNKHQDKEDTNPKKRIGQTTATKTSSSPSHYAYAYLLGGCDPDYPSYRPYMYSILISAYLLRKHGSTSDMYLFYEMHVESKRRKFPKHERHAFHGLNVTLIEIPSMRHPSFYQLQLQKFRVLGLTQYRRVFFLDSDVLPFSNLDYLMEFSDEQSDAWKAANFTEPPLQENFAVAGGNDPSNGGHFFLAPKPNDLQEINDLIQTKERRFMEQGIEFDPTIGWGSPIGMWNATKPGLYGHGWTFVAAGGDQGLLYYWTKYYKKRVSIQTLNGLLETWLPNNTHYEQPWPLPKQKSDVTLLRREGKGARHGFFHFQGTIKPWKNWPKDELRTISKTTRYRNLRYYWMYYLMKVNKRFNMQINITALEDKIHVPYAPARNGIHSVPYVLDQNKKHAILTNLLL